MSLQRRRIELLRELESLSEVAITWQTKLAIELDLTCWIILIVFIHELVGAGDASLDAINEKCAEFGVLPRTSRAPFSQRPTTAKRLSQIALGVKFTLPRIVHERRQDKSGPSTTAESPSRLA